MEISEQALARIVSGTRIVMQAEDDMQKFVYGSGTVLDEARGFLCDGLFLFSGEELKNEEDFDTDSRTMKALRSVLPDVVVAETIGNLNKEHHPDQSLVCTEEPEMPKPFFFRKKTEDMVRQGGGYAAGVGYIPPEKANGPKSTPEGEWS